MKRCPYYNRTILGKHYAGINCKARTYKIGFSNNPYAYFFGADTVNEFVVPGDYIEQRDAYISKFCNHCFKQCQFYKE